jgi:hypothetical protein
MTAGFSSARAARRLLALFSVVFFSAVFLLSALLQATPAVPSNGFSAQTSASAPWVVTIVLPPRVLAGHPATLAALDGEGKLLPGAPIQIGRQGEGRGASQSQIREFQSVTTNATGRVVFTALAEGGVLIATAPGATAVALAEADAGAGTGEATATGAGVSASAMRPLVVPAVISIRDRFSICGGDFRGDAEANRVTINGDPALVLAASPECLAVLPGPNAKPGAASVTVATDGVQRTATTTVVSLAFEAPHPPLEPQKTSALRVRVEGTEQPLVIVAENKSPGVLRFIRGDMQKLRTSGGASNTASIQVKTLRSGGFSFRAQLATATDLDTARKYLAAAAPLAAKDLQRKIAGLAKQLERRPGEAAKVKRDLGRILASVGQGDLRTILEAANSAM